jgi:hypothetical protein
MRLILKFAILTALVIWSTVQAVHAGGYGLSQQINLGGYDQDVQQVQLPAQAACYGQDVQQVVLQPVRQQVVQPVQVQPVQVQPVYAAPLRQQFVQPLQAGCGTQAFRSAPVRGFLGSGNVGNGNVRKIKQKQKIRFFRR